MSFSYISHLFSTHGLFIPLEVENIIADIILTEKRFKKINRLLDLSPKIKDIEQWEKEAKKTGAPDLRKNVRELRKKQRMTGCMDGWIFPECMAPQGEGVYGKSGYMLKKGVIIEYVNRMMYEDVWKRYTELEEDLVFGKLYMKEKRWIRYDAKKRIPLSQNDSDEEVDQDILPLFIQECDSIVMFKEPKKRETIFSRPGIKRSYSRHPIISCTARNYRHLTAFNPLDSPEKKRMITKHAVCDMIKSFFVKDDSQYDYSQGIHVYFIQDEDGNIRPR